MSFDAASRAGNLPLLATPPRFVSVAMEAFTPACSVTTPIANTQVLHLQLLALIVTAAAFLRFWGLDSVGLHGDEETMAMAVMGILNEGAPILPSGMFYPRGMTQLFLMAASVSVFGESEWSLRLPSAICGVVLVAISYLVGRRFLRPEWNLAFVAAIAFLPELIIYSQTARMYIFLVTCVAASMALVFTWERTHQTRWLVAATAALILGMDMQVLAVSAMFVFLLPGLIRSDARLLMQGIFACGVAVVAFVIINGLVEAQYPVPPPEFTASLGSPERVGSDVARDFSSAVDVIALVVCGLLAFLSWRVVRSIDAKLRLPAGLLLMSGVLLQLTLFYHLAALCYLVGTALCLRHACASTHRRLVILYGGIAMLAIGHAVLLASEAGTMIRLVGAMIGQPSVWPYVRVAQLSVAAGVAVGAVLLWGTYQLARGRTVPDYWLIAILMVWAPVFALGFFAWNIPPRYTAVSLMPMLICAFAALQALADGLSHRLRSARWSRVALPALAAIVVVNPVQAFAVIDAGYDLHPDHKGTAQFLQSQNISDEDIILAEDVLQQTYYLGKVDYWLIGPPVARRFVMSRDDEVVDFYTGTPVIVNEAMLDLVLLKNPDRRIFVIVSGEDQENGRRYVRGPEIHAALHSSRFETIYVGRDGLSKVLRAVPGGAAEIAVERQLTLTPSPTDGTDSSAGRSSSGRQR